MQLASSHSGLYTSVEFAILKSRILRNDGQGESEFQQPRGANYISSSFIVQARWQVGVMGKLSATLVGSHQLRLEGLILGA